MSWVSSVVSQNSGSFCSLFFLGKWILSSLKCIAQYACVQKGQISHPKDEKDTDQRERPEGQGSTDLNMVRALPAPHLDGGAAVLAAWSYWDGGK